MPIQKITNRYTEAVLFQAECSSIAACLALAIKAGANLSGADLYCANLSGANLSRANLKDTKGAELAIARTRILPGGTLVGWKKSNEGYIIKLEIPEYAKRSHAFGRKCRAELAIVREIQSQAGNRNYKKARSQDNPSFEYTIGATVKPDTKFSENWQEECASGIHFFITREEAVAY